MRCYLSNQLKLINQTHKEIIHSSSEIFGWIWVEEQKWVLENQLNWPNPSAQPGNLYVSLNNISVSYSTALKATIPCNKQQNIKADSSQLIKQNNSSP